MLPVLLPRFADNLYRVGCALFRAPAGWGNSSPLPAILLCGTPFLGAGSIVIAGLLLNARHHVPLIAVFTDLLFTVLAAQTIFNPRARITEAAPSTVRIPIQRRQT